MRTLWLRNVIWLKTDTLWIRIMCRAGKKSFGLIRKSLANPRISLSSISRHPLSRHPKPYFSYEHQISRLGTEQKPVKKHWRILNI